MPDQQTAPTPRPASARTSSGVLSVVVEQCLAPVPGGTGRYASEITAALAAGAPSGWTVRTVTAWHRDVAAAHIAGANGPHRLPAGHRVLNRLWRRGVPPWVSGTAVHATTPLAPPALGRTVVTVHDAVAWTHPETLSPRGVDWHRAMIGRAMKHAKAVVVPSCAVADDLAGIFPAASDRVHVVPHGVTALVAPPDAQARRDRMGLAEPYFLSVATLEPRKGLDVLIDALAMPAARRARLAVAGQPGWGGVDLPALAAAAGISPDRLVLLGRLPDEDLAAAMQGATALVAPSRSEGFGLPVLEAFAAGTPVICSDAPALVELSGGAAIVVPCEDRAALADALESFDGVDGPSAELRRRGLERAALFSWAAAADALWRLHTS
ncbi:glycosyltransferase family 4 protein [Nakamurella sp. GG22]